MTFDNVTIIHAGMTEQELHSLFNEVCNKENWKLPIEAEIDITDCCVKANKVMDAIQFFCGGKVEWSAGVDFDHIHLSHKGYYYWIGA